MREVFGVTLEGGFIDGRIEVLGSYPANAKKPWGWRIELGLESSQLVMRMYNITPRGKERIAVEMIGDAEG